MALDAGRSDRHRADHRTGPVAAAARQPGRPGRRASTAGPGQAGHHRARWAGRGHHHGRQPDRCDARAGPRACAGALFRDGPDAPQCRWRAVGAVRAEGHRRRQAHARAPAACTHRGESAGRTGRQRRGRARLRGWRQRGPGRSLRAPVGLSAAAAAAATVAGQRQRVDRAGHVRRPAGPRQPDRAASARWCRQRCTR